jgi:hypothetical protein
MKERGGVDVDSGTINIVRTRIKIIIYPTAKEAGKTKHENDT